MLFEQRVYMSWLQKEEDGARVRDASIAGIMGKDSNVEQLRAATPFERFLQRGSKKR